MRKTAFILILSSLILAIVAAIVRVIEINSIFDPVTGLALAWAPVSIILLLLCIITAALSFFLVFRLKYAFVPKVFHRAFSIPKPVFMFASFALAALMLFAAILFYGEIRDNISANIPEAILALVAAASGIAFASISFNSYKSRTGIDTVVSAFVITIFFCYWLVLTYKQRAADPVILDYVYDALALCSAAVASYYITGFCFNRGSLQKTLFSTSLASFFSLVAAVGAPALPLKLFYAFTVAIMLLFSFYLTLNISDVPKS